MYVITVQGIDGVTIQNEPVPVLANSTVSIVKISNTAWRLHSSGSGSGGGSGGAVRQWDLTPITLPATATVWAVPAPYTNQIYNVAGVFGTQYNAERVPLPEGSGYYTEMSIVELAVAPFIGNTAFWWKPMVGGVDNTLQLIETNTFLAIFNMYVHPTLGLHVVTNNYNYNDYADPAFVEGDTVLVQISDTGVLSIKTANITTTIIDTLVIAAGDVVAAIGYLDPSHASTITGQLAGSDLGSGIAVDVGYVAINTQAPGGLPAQSANGDILQVTVPGTYKGVPFTVNEGAIVMDADNGLVAPMVYESVVQPIAFSILFLNVGPTYEYKSLHTLHTDLINRGIFCNNLYVVYSGTTIESNAYLSFPSIDIVVIIVTNSANNTVTNTDCSMVASGGRADGIYLSGNWEIGSLYATKLSLDGTIRAHNGIIQITDFDSLSTTNLLQSKFGLHITNFGPFKTSFPIAIISKCSFHCYDESQGTAGVVQLRGNTNRAEIDLHGCNLEVYGGNHSFSVTYHHRNEASNPNSVVVVKEMANCNIPSIAVPNPNGWADIPRGIELVSGLVTAPSITGSVTTAYSQTPGTITSNGIIFG